MNSKSEIKIESTWTKKAKRELLNNYLYGNLYFKVFIILIFLGIINLLQFIKNKKYFDLLDVFVPLFTIIISMYDMNKLLKKATQNHNLLLNNEFLFLDKIKIDYSNRIILSKNILFIFEGKNKAYSIFINDEKLKIITSWLYNSNYKQFEVYNNPFFAGIYQRSGIKTNKLKDVLK